MSSAGDYFGDAPDDSRMNQTDILNVSRKGKKVGASRTKAYDMAECIAITRAMIAVKNDPMRGADAKFEDFLSRFKEKYDVFKRKEFPNRSVLSLHDKFKEIWYIYSVLLYLGDGDASDCDCWCAGGDGSESV